jgi:biofilm protein TabA
MIHDALSNWPIYFHEAPWKQVFEFLGSLTPDSPDSSCIDLAGDGMYAAIMTYQTCLPQESKLEAHNKYIDIQMSLTNSEAIDWYPRDSLRVKTPYDPGRDRTLYHCPEQAPGRVSNSPGFFTVLFPHDAHMPKLITGSNPEIVKKAVVKLNINAMNKS